MRRVRCGALIAAFSMLFVTGAFAGERMPDWVTTPYKAYPSELYVAAVGSSASRAAAEVEAIRGIAAVFGQSVASTTIVSKRMTQAQEDGMVAVTTSSASIDDSVRRQVDADTIVAVEIRGAWRDERRAMWHVIAVMDKKAAAVTYASMIRQNHAALRSLLERVHTEPRLEDYAVLDFAESVACVTDGYLARLTVLAASEAEMLAAPEFSAGVVRARLRELAALIPIAVQIGSDSEGRVAKALSETVSARGFTVIDAAKGGQAARYLLRANITKFEQNVADKRGLFVIDFTVVGAFIDLVTGEEVIPFTLSGSEGSKTAENARVRVYTTMERAVRQRFDSAFTAYLDGFSL